jgi:hypothetical protein
MQCIGRTTQGHRCRRVICGGTVIGLQYVYACYEHKQQVINRYEQIKEQLFREFMVQEVRLNEKSVNPADLFSGALPPVSVMVFGKLSTSQ